MILQACIGQVLRMLTKKRLWKTPSADSALPTISGKFILKMGRKSFTDAPPDADDGGGLDGVLAMRDGGDVEDGMRLGQRVVAGVVADQAFVAQRLGRVNVAFDDEVGVGGNFEVVRFALTSRASFG